MQRKEREREQVVTTTKGMLVVVVKFAVCVHCAFRLPLLLFFVSRGPPRNKLKKSRAVSENLFSTYANISTYKVKDVFDFRCIRDWRHHLSMSLLHLCRFSMHIASTIRGSPSLAVLITLVLTQGIFLGYSQEWVLVSSRENYDEAVASVSVCRSICRAKTEPASLEHRRLCIVQLDDTGDSQCACFQWTLFRRQDKFKSVNGAEY